MLSYYPSKACSFLKENGGGEDLEENGGVGKLEGMEGGKTVIRMDV